MKSYYRIMLGRKSIHADECFNGQFIGVDFIPDFDLNGKLPDNWRTFNKEFIPKYQQFRPDISKVVAGLACGAAWTVCKGMQIGDIVLSPDGTGVYRFGQIASEYEYAKGEALPHRRRVSWLPQTISRAQMSDALRNSSGSIGTISNITGYSAEIETYISNVRPQVIVSNDETVEDPMAFAMEKHLEEFLVRNWASTEFGKEYDIFGDDGELVGQQYPTDTGAIDVLAISKDKKRLLVIELKKGRASDAVVGQVLRYMGFVQDELSEKNQQVLGAIIALEDDQRIRRALSVTPNISFYRYKIEFKLLKA